MSQKKEIFSKSDFESLCRLRLGFRVYVWLLILTMAIWTLLPVFQSEIPSCDFQNGLEGLESVLLFLTCFLSWLFQFAAFYALWLFFRSSKILGKRLAIIGKLPFFIRILQTLIFGLLCLIVCLSNQFGAVTAVDFLFSVNYFFSSWFFPFVLLVFLFCCASRRESSVGLFWVKWLFFLLFLPLILQVFHNLAEGVGSLTLRELDLLGKEDSFAVLYWLRKIFQLAQIVTFLVLIRAINSNMGKGELK